MATTSIDADLLGALAVGWYFGSASMLAFSFIVAIQALRRFKGASLDVGTLSSIAAVYVLFGTAALILRSFSLHFLLFVMTGILVAAFAIIAPKVKAWLARRRRFHVHFTPTYASWINLVERWFGIITQQAIRRGSFSNVKTLIRRIKEFVDHYNANSRPFVWTATADSILEKVERLALLISGTRH